MPIEHEAKVLDVDAEGRSAHSGSRGQTEAGRRPMRRHVYDIVPGDMTKWIRLRDNGSEITLCVKEIRSDAIDGTLEVETAVGDFIAANELLGLPLEPNPTRRTGGRASSWTTLKLNSTSGR